MGKVTWIDDQNPMDMPLSMLDTETVEEYYKDKTALYSITIKEEDINDTVPRISVFLVLPGMLYVTDRQKNKI